MIHNMALVIILILVMGVVLIPERVSLKYMNEKYITDPVLNIRRISKKGEYVMNIIGTTTVPLGNNVTFSVALYERSTKYNQYIRSYIEFQYKLCDMIEKDQIFGAVLRKLGVTKCPIQPGLQKWTNVSVSRIFNFEIPFEKGKVESKLKNEAANELIGIAEVFFSKQTTKRKT